MRQIRKNIFAPQKMLTAREFARLFSVKTKSKQMEETLQKFEKLKESLKSLKSVAVAVSSGVDSAFLLKAASDVLGESAAAITAKSRSFANREFEEAKAFCKKYGIRQIIVETDELEIEGFRKNPPNRCYICKKNIFEKILEAAAQNGFKYVAEGSNTDDDYRPGMKALRELGILSPLKAAILSKSEIRALSKKLGLPTWDKPSFACLASRFAYGEEITKERLQIVEKAEQLLFDLGFKQLRVRLHSNIARIEVLPQDFEKAISNREKICSELKKLGLAYITLDLNGYRLGSMNEVL